MIGGMAARLLTAFAMTALASQTAEFTQQYFQRLGGAADELIQVVRRFDESAGASGMARGEALDRLRSHTDSFVSGQGRDMDSTIARAERLQDRYDDLRSTTPILRPVVALSDPDWDIAGRTFDDYRPALPVTGDGLALTFLGFLLGWTLGAYGHGAIHMKRSRRRRRRSVRLPWSKPLLIEARPEESGAFERTADNRRA